MDNFYTLYSDVQNIGYLHENKCIDCPYENRPIVKEVLVYIVIADAINIHLSKGACKKASFKEGCSSCNKKELTQYEKIHATFNRVPGI